MPGTKVIYSKDGTVAQVDVPTPGSGNDAPSMHALNVLRDQIIPATVGRRRGRDRQRQRRRGQLGGLRQISSRAGCR